MIENLGPIKYKWNLAEIQGLFLSENKTLEHMHALMNARDLYLRQLKLVIKCKVMLTVSTSTKARILAAIMIRNENEVAEWLLTYPQLFI